MEKIYKTQIRIQILKIEGSRVIEVVGHGKAAVEDQSQVSISHPLLEMSQSLLPEQFARLSQEILVFPPIATNNLNIRVLFIENLCSDRLSFEWSQTEILSTEPVRAEIGPGKKFLLQVKVIAGTRSEDIDEPLECILTRSNGFTNVLYCHIRTLVVSGKLFKPNPAPTLNSTTRLEGGRVLRPTGLKKAASLAREGQDFAMRLLSELIGEISEHRDVLKLLEQLPHENMGGYQNSVMVSSKLHYSKISGLREPVENTTRRNKEDLFVERVLTGICANLADEILQGKRELHGSPKQYLSPAEVHVEKTKKN